MIWCHEVSECGLYEWSLRSEAEVTEKDCGEFRRQGFTTP